MFRRTRRSKISDFRPTSYEVSVSGLKLGKVVVPVITRPAMLHAALAGGIAETIRWMAPALERVALAAGG